MIGTVRFAARRANGPGGVLLTATLTALAAAILMVSATVLAPGTAENALDRTVGSAGAHDTVLVASTGLDDTFDDVDEHVRASSAATGAMTQPTATARSTAFASQALGPDARVAVAAIEDAERHARLVSGRWPSAGAPTTETVVHPAALDAFGVAVGDILSIESLTGSNEVVDLAVVGTFEPTDPHAPVWHGYGFGVRLPVASSDLTIVGPLLVDLDHLVHGISPSTATASWVLPLASDDLTVDNASATTESLRGLADDLTHARAGEFGQDVTVTGGAIDLVDQAGEAAAATRALLLVVVSMLALLGLWALAFTARLVAARRAPANALVRARGAGESRLARWSVLGTLPPAVAVALAAPPLSELALNPLRTTGTLTAGSASALAWPGWLAAAAVGAVWLVLMVTADLRSGRSGAAVSAEAARPRRALAQRAGLDVLLLVIGLVALQQLRQSPDSTSGAVLVAAPSLVVLAGAAMLIRVLPWLAALVARGVTLRPTAAAMLAAQETSRRSVRHVGASVLVILAISTAVFAATTQDTWRGFTADAVDVREPADVRLILGATSADLVHGIESGVTDLPGAEQGMPVYRSEFRSGDLAVDVVGVDPDAALTIMRWDADMARGDPAARLASLIGDGDGGAVPVLATAGFASTLGLSTGGQTTLDVPGEGPTQFQVSGVVDAVPGSDSSVAMLVDGSVYRRLIGDGKQQSDVVEGCPVDTVTSEVRCDLPRTEEPQQAPAEPRLPDEWWVATGDDGRAAAEAASGLRGVSDVATHVDVAAEAADDPAAAGITTGLTAGVVFAAVFVLIGATVHTTTSLQSRLEEHAVLSAIGLSRRGVVVAAAVENAVVLGFSTLAGLGLGALVSRLVVPHTVTGLAGLPEVPPLHLDYPTGLLTTLGIAVVTLLVALVALHVRLTRRIDVAGVLRAGEDT